jgi:pyridoxal phosphate enzyme (YggS family)
MITAAGVAEAAREVRQRIDAAGGRDVDVVAVTKGFGPDAIRAAVKAGLGDIGENYAQELLAKLAEVVATGTPPERVHFIGRLQSNKVRLLAGAVDLWQTVDRLSLGTELARRAPGARVLVQVNVTDEASKGGCRPEDAGGLITRLRDLDLAVEGVMTIGATGAPEGARPGFRLLRRIADEHGLATCSMGMTDDLEVAVEEGSTMVRVGSALFGLRPVPRSRSH